jgi:hypothetical protein
MSDQPITLTVSGAVDASEAGLGKAVVVGAAAGFLVVVPIVALMLLVAGAGPRSALGVGVYVALWGGPGFGAMFGAVRHVSRSGDGL